MIILGIDTSCDDTSVAILKIENYRAKRDISSSPSSLVVEARKLKILSNVVSSQEKLHAKYGGVYPFLAKREHQKNLPVVLKKALRQAQAKQKFEKPDLIAITVGPGLEPCLWTGINFAKELAKKMKLPIVPINHIEAHILANTINSQQLTINNFPAVCLVVSGGHTQLILMKNFGKYRILGETRDDAAGECFDKTARILNLAYPGGPAIASQATKLDKEFDRERVFISLPRPMIYQKNYDFSFSGLKTAVLYDFKKRSPKIRKSLGHRPTGEAKQYLQEMSAEIQQAIIDVLIHKTLKAAKDYKVKSIILAGGVAANEELREQFILKVKGQKLKVKFLVPPKNLCTDNAAMVAVAGYFKWDKKKVWKKIKANANLRIDEPGTF